ncbi:MAG: hotdog fold thioesterase [Myxococcota bacterium]
MDARLLKFFEEGIAFNRLLGMKLERVEAGKASIRVPFRDELVGDPFRPALHGGVLSALADTAGGLAVWAQLGSMDARVSTVDLRVDYYAPAALRDVIADAEVVRLGNRVGVARITLHHGDPAHVVAEGKGVYNIRAPSRRTD